MGDFKLLMELDLVKRVFLPSTSESGEEPSPPSSKLPEPDLKALALLLEKEDATLPSMIDMADSSVFWRLNTDTAALMLRDKLIVEASTRRHDIGAGKVVSSLLHLVSATSKDWAPVSSHIGHHTIVEKVASEHGKTEPASDTSTSTSSFCPRNDWLIEWVMQGVASTALTWNISQRNWLKRPWTVWCWNGLGPRLSEYFAMFERRNLWRRAACRGW